MGWATDDSHRVAIGERRGVTRTLVFRAEKNPGAGDPTNTVRIETDRGVVGRVESGPVGAPADRAVEIPAGASWVMLANEDGSALRVYKYPTVDATELTEVIDHSRFFVDYPDRWTCDWVRLRLP